jgi:pimeloyl-ACP methyl ester carboxylesterase
MILSSIIIGKGHVLIVLHGLFGEGKNWMSIAKEISSDFEVHLIDQRNHGNSFHDCNHNYKTMASDLNRYIKKNSINNFSIIGHSMGGKTAMQFAVLYPENINKLIIVDIAPKMYKENYFKIFEGFKKVLLQSKSRKEAQIMLMEHVDDLVLTNFLLKGVSFLDGKPKLKFNIHAIQNNIQNMLAAPEKSINFNGPTYFLHGSKSEYIQNKDIESINQLFPCNQVIKINNAGHWIHFDQKQQFINCIKDIFKNK